ncbi:MAG: hypothetical protein A4E25_01463 [Methanobacterium sp. PtaB.Bin024]|nr:MAG: hypothetical protein A4E25_01463 [Methanobacterium sp. PtaB.Bin024]
MKGIMIYSDEIDKKTVKPVLKRIHNLGFTDVFYVTKNIDGKVYYSSKIAETRENTLKLLCDAAKKYNIGVYAWFCTFTEGYEGNLFGNGTSKFFIDNPELSAKDVNLNDTIEKPVRSDQGSENYLCPANPRVFQYELSLMEEIANNYDIKGIHLDFMRFPLPGNYCYCDYCVMKFEEKYGVSIFSDDAGQYLPEWRKNVISNFVNKIYKNSKFKSNVQLSALVWKYDDCLEKTQDWKNWNVDFVTPMFYNKGYLKGVKWVYNEIKHNKNSSKNTKIIAAIGGSFSNFFTKEEWNKLEKTVKKANLEGFIIGHYGLFNVLDTLEKDTILTSLKKRAKWTSHKAIIKLYPLLKKTFSLNK